MHSCTAGLTLCWLCCVAEAVLWCLWLWCLWLWCLSVLPVPMLHAPCLNSGADHMIRTGKALLPAEKDPEPGEATGKPGVGNQRAARRVAEPGSGGG